MGETVARRTWQPPPQGEQADSWGLAFILVTLFMSICIMYFLHWTNFRYMPESVGVILIGIALGFLVRWSGREVNQVLALDPESFFLLLLPPIIFESGYNLNKRNFFKNLGTIVLFAVVGTVISTIVVGFGVYWFGLIPSIGYEISLVDSLTFGSLISAVDPVATLAIFNALEVNPTLHMLVFGESVLNDAVAVVLYRTMVLISHTPLTASVLGIALLRFFYTFLGSVGIGLAIGLFSSLTLKYIHFRNYPSLELALVLLFAYFPYVTAEGVGLSGIMAILFGAIVMSHYTSYNLSPITKLASERFYRAFALLAETGVFAYLGLAVSTFEHSFNLWLILVSVAPITVGPQLLILVGRVLNIYPLAFLANLFRRRNPITPLMQFVMFFSGLRGAIAFALAINLAETSTAAPMLITTTLAIVLFTIVVFGGGTFPLLKLLEQWKKRGVSDGGSNGPHKAMSLAGALDRATRDESTDELPGATTSAEQSANWFERLDNRYFIRLFRSTATPEMYRAARHELHELVTAWPPTPDDERAPDHALRAPQDPSSVAASASAGARTATTARASARNGRATPPEKQQLLGPTDDDDDAEDDEEDDVVLYDAAGSSRPPRRIFGQTGL